LFVALLSTDFRKGMPAELPAVIKRNGCRSRACPAHRRCNAGL